MNRAVAHEFRNRFRHIIDKCTVPNCKGGFIQDPSVRPFQEKEEKPWVQCECLKKSVLFTRLYEANVPQEYYELSLKNFDMRNVPAKDGIKEGMFETMKYINGIMDNIKDFHDSGTSLLIHGSAGVGKTMISIEILKKAVSEKFSIYYDFYPSIVDAFKKKGYVADDVKARYSQLFAEVDFLVLDELGKEDAQSSYNSRDFSSSRFLEIDILKKRNLKPTIIITNLNGMEEISRTYGQFVNSMMSHRFKELKIVSNDFRLKGQG